MWKLVIIMFAGTTSMNLGPDDLFRSEIDCYRKSTIYVGAVIQVAKKNGVIISDLDFKCLKIS